MTKSSQAAIHQPHPIPRASEQTLRSRIILSFRPPGLSPLGASTEHRRDLRRKARIAERVIAVGRLSDRVDDTGVEFVAEEFAIHRQPLVRRDAQGQIQRMRRQQWIGCALCICH